MLMMLCLTGCYSTSHRNLVELPLDQTEGRLVVVEKDGTATRFETPARATIESDLVVITSRLLPTLSFDLHKVHQVELETLSPAKTGIAVGASVLGLAAVVAAAIGGSVALSHGLRQNWNGLGW